MQADETCDVLKVLKLSGGSGIYSSGYIELFILMDI